MYINRQLCILLYNYRPTWPLAEVSVTSGNKLKAIRLTGIHDLGRDRGTGIAVPPQLVYQ